MDVEVVTVGTELLLGFTIDTNAADISRALAAIGARVVHRATVPDVETSIRAAVGAGLERTGLVIVTGGLGPTRDDITKRAVASLFGVPLEVDAAYLAGLEARWRRLGRGGSMPEANRSQAEIPRGATVLPNPRGTAPGLWLDGDLGIAILLPGVPHEMRGLVRDAVVPRLAERVDRGGERTVVRSRTLRTTGVAESALADRLGAHEAELRPATLAYLPSFLGVDLRLTVGGLGGDAADRALTSAAERLGPLLGADCYGDDETDLAAVLLAGLAQRGQSLAVAESCTGGLLGARLTAIAGASDVFLGGVITYRNALKTSLLGVDPALLAAHGAVSEEVVRAMAAGARERLGADVALAVTGIAGPTGGTEEKPVGTVWLGVAAPEVQRAVRIRFPGARDEVRQRAAQGVLDLARRALGMAPVPANPA
ncbi:MAG TPA: competence/damage-inducible protein A [Gemmatimonadales bacterium]|nr:competence/damage-inducible protein A [Gemmatimonadales bacterium]